MKWIALVALVALAACNTPEETTRPIVISSQPIDRPALNLPPVDEFNARPVEWVVVTPDNVDQVFADMQARGEAPALFGVNEQGYENIAVNNQQALRVIMQQQAVIQGYREYYVRVDRNIRTHNDSIRTQ